MLIEAAIASFFKILYVSEGKILLLQRIKFALEMPISMGLDKRLEEHVARETIHISQLKVGLFIYIDLDWSEHPFMFRAFKIKNSQQINTLKKLGLSEIVYDPERSKIAPGEKVEVVAANDVVEVVEEEAESASDVEDTMEEKHRRIEQLRERRKSLHRTEKAFTETAKAVKGLMTDMRARPREALDSAEELVGGMVEQMTAHQQVTMQMVNMKGKDESSYYHVVNVMALSLLLGKEMKLSDIEMHHLGVGAILHDFGHLKIPDKILRKASPLTDPERKVYQAHARFGAELARKIGSLPEAVVEILQHHHEREDGSGYPEGLAGYEISKLAKIVAIADAYDEYCNGAHRVQLFTPFEAMSLMYSKEKHKYDERILALFISRMGIYPPGTLVKLSNNRVAGVTAVNPKALLKPQVVVYDREIPKEEAIILDLNEEEDLTILESLRRNEVPSEMLSYLNFGDSINYFSDPGADKT